MRKFLAILIIFFQVVISGIYGQSTYPVQATPTLTPPYSLNLSDYSKFGSQQLMVNITVKDLNISNMPVKLRIKLETMGVTIENPPTINTTPIYIDGGSTTILFGKDLADNFNVKNLIFKGYSKEAYARTGQLPEGFYRFTVEVLHFNNNRPVSNQGTATAWITLGKPPVLKLPLNNTQLGQFKGMPITFSWLASNVGSPVSANSIQYKFEMWEMRIDGIAPNTVAASMPVFHEHTTFNTMYSLYPSTLLMEPGMKYAWRITASDVSGFVPFEQNGQSEIRTFEYKAACDSVTNFAATQRGQSGQFSWDAEENHTSFNVEMRNPGTGWVSNSEAYDSRAEFFDLDYGTTYEMRVQAVCNGDPESTSDYSGWQTLKIEEPEPLIDTATCPDCSCDDEIPQAELTNFELKKDLKPGDTIVNKTGTTRYILEAVEPQGDGIYKGVFLFWAEIWNLQIYCDYWDLQVNTDNVIVNMDFESVYNPQFLLDVDATKEYLNNLAGAITTLTTDTEIKDTLAVTQTITSIYVNGGDSVIAVTVDENGKIKETLLHNNANDLEKTLVKGKNGEEYVVTKRGDVMGVDEYKKTGGKKKNIDRYNEEKEKTNLSETAEINFLKSEGQEYGFDAYNEEKMALLSQYPTLNNGYRPAYKSVASYSTDVVETSGDGESTIFKDEMGIPALRTGENLTIRGSADGSEVALYAYQPVSDSTEEIAGKLNILSYDENAVKLYIVPVNDAVLPDAEKLQETLNAIYGQAVTEWTVEAKEKVEVSFENGNMVHGESSAFTVYNTDQKAIVKAYESSKNGKLEKGAFYLFFVNNVQFKNRSIAGYMPLQRQVGFIYDSPGLNTIAHELGHGAFNLLHTFSTEKFLAGEGTTQNLMDYKGGTELWKHQWENVQSPEKILFAWSKDEEEGEMENGISFVNTPKEIGLRTKSAKFSYKISDYGSSSEKVRFRLNSIGKGKKLLLYEEEKTIKERERVFVWDLICNSGAYKDKRLDESHTHLEFELDYNDNKAHERYIYDEKKRVWEKYVLPSEQFYDIEIKKMSPGFEPDYNELKMNYLVTCQEIKELDVVLRIIPSDNKFWEFAVHDKITASDKHWYKDKKTGYYCIKKVIVWDGKIIEDNKPTVVSRESFPADAELKLYKKDSETTEYASAQKKIKLVPKSVLEEWKLYNKGIMRGNIAGGLDGYVKFRQLYKTESEFFEENPDEIPLKHFKDNLVRIDFLGKTIIIHKMLEEFFKELDNRVEIDYPATHTYFMREINGSAGMSPHAFGLAVDFLPKKNPQITKSRGQSRHLILKSTDFDIAKSKKDIYDYFDIKSKHELFQSLFYNKNTSITILLEKYQLIDAYNKNEISIKYELGFKKNINENLQGIKVSIEGLIEAQGLQGNVNNLQYDETIQLIDQLIETLEHTINVADAYYQTVVFKQTGELSDLKIELNKILERLNLIKINLKCEALFDNCTFNTLEYKNQIESILMLQGDYSKLWDEIQSFYIVTLHSSRSKRFYNKKYSLLEDFGKALDVDMRNIGFNNVLLEDGFCDVDIKIIDEFFKLAKEYGIEQYAQWGGLFGSKIDAMHIGFNQTKYKQLKEKLESKSNENEKEISE